MPTLFDPFEQLREFQGALDTFRSSGWLGSGLSAGGAYPPINVFGPTGATRSIADAPVVKSRACDPPVRMMTSGSCGGVARAGPRRATSDLLSCRSTRRSTSSPPRASSGSVLNLQSVTKCANSSSGSSYRRAGAASDVPIGKPN